MATFTTSNAAAPDSLESVLNSLQNLIDSNRHRPAHSLVNPTIPEPFNQQTAEPLVTKTSVTEMLQQHIPVLNDVISEQSDEPSSQPISAAQIEKTLNELREELSGIVANIMLETREQLEKQETSSQEVLETSLKHFIHELSELSTPQTQ
ncbi:MAG: hypothetical protein KAT25_01005 [Sulfuriflexus sp.]|nr:hypothetical protein [Sulfuriflexus sp.]